MENYDEIWKQVLGNMPVRSTAMLLKLEASIKAIDETDVTLIVTDMWMAMVKAKESMIINAFESVLGKKCSLHLIPVSIEKKASIATLPRRRVWPD